MGLSKASSHPASVPFGYAIAEIKFQRIHDFEKKLPKLISKLTEEYPLEEDGPLEHSFDPSNSKSPNSLELYRDFKSLDSKLGIRISSKSAALHCTDFILFKEKFESKWFELINILHETLKPRVLIRSSIRRVDLLVPKGKDSADKYLTPSLRPWDIKKPELGTFEQGNTIARFKNDDISTTILVLARVNGNTLLPPTLTAMTLILSPAQIEARKYYQETNKSFAMMDTDVAYEGAILFDIKKITEIHKKIYNNSSVCFEEATSHEAKLVWEKS